MNDGFIRIQKELTDIRKAKNITQKELAKSIGKTQQYISKFEKCNGDLIVMIPDIANVLGYDIQLKKRVDE